jgi:hypothetical protein
VNIYQSFIVLLSAVTLSCGNGDSDADLQSEYGAEKGSVSALDLFLDENGFESVNSINEMGETPLQVALRTHNNSAAVILLENGADDGMLFTLDTARAGLFEIGIGKDEIPEIASVYGDVTIEEIDLNLEGMYTPAVEITFPGESSPGLVLEIWPDVPGNVYRIKVLSGRFKTEHGTGVSSTVAEFWEFYSFGDVYCGESGNPVMFIDQLGASVVITPGDWWVMGEVQGVPPADAVVEAILIL